MSNNTSSIPLNVVSASNEVNLPNNNLNQNNLVKVKKNIPVDLNSEVLLHERWNCPNTRAPPPVPNGGLFSGPLAMEIMHLFQLHQPQLT